MFNDASKKFIKTTTDSVEVDIREDEEQNVKCQEIIDLLVNAGYYRARISGLANFDKIVGGMTWCMESCYFDVDVDLLFQENSTIGQKIALTEKIVAVLPKMNCPFRIEPHQIQGLDCIHIHPVIQWLVTESIKVREEMAKYVQQYAITRYNKKYEIKDYKIEDIENSNIYKCVKHVKKAYEPLPRYKSKEPIKSDEFSILSNTLLEYGETLQIPQSVINKLQEMKSTTMSAEEKELTQEMIHKKIEQKKRIDELLKNLSRFDDNLFHVSSNVMGKIARIQAQEVSNITEEFKGLNSDATPDKVTIAAQSELVLKKKELTLENKLNKLKKERDDYEEKITEIQSKLEKYKKKKLSAENIIEKMKNINDNDSKGTLKRLEELLIIHDGLKEQQLKFREQCMIDLNTLNSKIEESETINPEEDNERLTEYNNLKESVNRHRIKLAKKNRAIAKLMRQLDDIPGRSELTQYQRRFMELYNQVSAKLKETKQYYTLYNTLDDTKLYLSKELSLLNSIQENYNEAMSSNSAKEQFLQQFDLIIEGIQKNKLKVEKRCTDEKHRRDTLSRQLQSLMEQQRKYVVAVRQLTIECRKNETLLSKLRNT